MARLRFGHSAAPRMTTSDLCIIDGIEFDSNLRETGNFYGHAVELGPNRSASPLLLNFEIPQVSSDKSKDRSKDKRKDKASDEEQAAVENKVRLARRRFKRYPLREDTR